MNTRFPIAALACVLALFPCLEAAAQISPAPPPAKVPTPAQADADFLKSIDDLATAVRKSDAAKNLADPKNANLAKALGELINLVNLIVVGNAPCSAAVDKAVETDCRLDQIKALADGTAPKLKDTRLSDAQWTKLTDAIVEILKAPATSDADANLTHALALATAIATDSVIKVTRPDLDLAALAQLTSALSVQISKVKSEDITARQMASAKTSVTSIKADLRKVSDTLKIDDRRIRIKGAWYGDLVTLWSRVQRPTSSKEGKRPAAELDPYRGSRYYCSATRAIRARCQGKTQCYEPSSDTASLDGVTTEIDGKTLCGYEPEGSLYADPARRGLLIYYECVSSIDKFWSDPALVENFLSKAESATASGYANLRIGALSVIRCQSEISAAGGPPAAGKQTTKSSDVAKSDGTDSKTITGPATTTGDKKTTSGQEASE